MNGITVNDIDIYAGFCDAEVLLYRLLLANFLGDAPDDYASDGFSELLHAYGYVHQERARMHTPELNSEYASYRSGRRA